MFNGFEQEGLTNEHFIKRSLTIDGNDATKIILSKCFDVRHINNPFSSPSETEVYFEQRETISYDSRDKTENISIVPLKQVKSAPKSLNPSGIKKTQSGDLSREDRPKGSNTKNDSVGQEA